MKHAYLALAIACALTAAALLASCGSTTVTYDPATGMWGVEAVIPTK